MKPPEQFFIAGGTLRPDASCYLERNADGELYESLLRREFCYVLTARQMGKSSLMIRTAVRLRTAGIAVAVLDLTAIGQNLSPEQWYGGLLSQLGERLALEDELLDSWRTLSSIGLMQRWMQIIREIVLPRYPEGLVIFIDEIDAVRSLPFSVDEFLAGIRECYNQRSQSPIMERLSFCLLGVAAPSELIRDIHNTPFNIGHRIELYDFSWAEVQPFANSLDRDSTSGMELLRRIMYWTQGHPYLTQRLCLLVAQRRDITRPNSIDRLCAELFFSSRALERDDNLLFVRERMLRSEVEITSLLDLYRRVEQGRRVRDEEANAIISTLQLSGITRTENGFLRVRNRIYQRVFDRRWIEATMPLAELRRQKAAFRRGLGRAALVSSLILLLLAGFAIAALQQRRRAEQETKNYLRLLYYARMRLAQEQWDNANVERVEELLEQTKPQLGQEDLRGFEWYQFWRLTHLDAWRIKARHAVAALVWSADGKTTTIAERGPAAQGKNAEWTLRDYDLASKREVNSLRVPADTSWSLVSFSSDGMNAAVADPYSSGNATISLWNIRAGKRIAIFQGHKDQICSLAFSPLGDRLLSADMSGVVLVWNLKTGKKQLQVFQSSHRVTLAAISPDGGLLAVLTEESDKLHLWNLHSTREIKPLTGQALRFTSAAFFPTGQRLLTASKDGSLQIWDLRSHRLLTRLPGHSGYVNAVAFSHSGRMLATASYDRTIKLLSADTGQEIKTIKGHGSAVLSIAWSRDDTFLATAGEDTTVKFWDMTTKQDLILPPKTGSYEATAFFKNDELLALGVTESPTGPHLQIWNLSTGQTVAQLNEPADNMMCAIFSPDRAFLAIGGADKTITLWNFSTGQLIKRFTGSEGGVKGLALSPDDRWLASGGDDHKLRVWELATGRPVSLNDGSNDYSWRVAFSPDGKYLAAAALDGSVKLWNVAAARLEHVFRGHTDIVKAIAFSPDGKLMVTGGNDLTLRLWSVDRGKEQADLGLADYIQRATFSPDGRRLVTGGVNGTVTLWDVTAHQELVTLKGHSEEITSITFSADGANLATSAHDSIVRLWRAASYNNGGSDR